MNQLTIMYRIFFIYDFPISNPIVNQCLLQEIHLRNHTFVLNITEIHQTKCYKLFIAENPKAALKNLIGGDVAAIADLSTFEGKVFIIFSSNYS